MKHSYVPVLLGIFQQRRQVPAAIDTAATSHRQRLRFDGPAYERRFDQERLTGQMARIWTVMADRAWRTLSEIETETGDPPASISAQLRHLRKARFGAHTVERRARGDRANGLWEYRLLPAEPLA